MKVLQVIFLAIVSALFALCTGKNPNLQTRLGVQQYRKFVSLLFEILPIELDFFQLLQCFWSLKIRIHTFSPTSIFRLFNLFQNCVSWKKTAPVQVKLYQRRNHCCTLTTDFVSMYAKTANVEMLEVELQSFFFIAVLTVQTISSITLLISDCCSSSFSALYKVDIRPNYFQAPAWK